MLVSGSTARQHARSARPAHERVRAAVILGEPSDVVIEGVQARGRQQPGLAHRSTECVATRPRASDERIGPREQRAHRAAEALAQAHADAVSHARQLGQLAARGDVGVPQPRAVHVDGPSLRSRDRGDLSGWLRTARPDRPRARACSRARPGRPRGQPQVSSRIRSRSSSAENPLRSPMRWPRPRTDERGRRLRGRGREPRRRIRATSPGRACEATASWLAMVPDGTNSAAGFPSSAATRCSSAFTFGSSA